MTVINDFFGKVSATFAGSTTMTGLDVLECASQPARVAEQLLACDLVPATPAEITATYCDLYGAEPSQEQYLELEQFLITFDWLAQPR